MPDKPPFMYGFTAFHTGFRSLISSSSSSRRRVRSVVAVDRAGLAGAAGCVGVVTGCALDGRFRVFTTGEWTSKLVEKISRHLGRVHPCRVCRVFVGIIGVYVWNEEYRVCVCARATRVCLSTRVVCVYMGVLVCMYGMCLCV